MTEEKDPNREALKQILKNVLLLVDEMSEEELFAVGFAAGLRAGHIDRKPRRPRRPASRRGRAS